MIQYDIQPTQNTKLEAELQQKIDMKTKPVGALGFLENIAHQTGLIQQTLSPEIKKPVIVVFAGDHGIAKKGEVNPFPQEVTSQMVYNFINGGAAINVFSRTNNADLKIVDAGVNHNFDTPHLIDCKIDYGTKNYQEESAMSAEQCEKALRKGGEIVEQAFKNGSNTIGFGEMGIANTSSASLLMSYFTGIPIEECVGAGTGLNSEGISKKREILTSVFNKHQPSSPLEALAMFGGFEIAMLCGAILKAAELKMIVLIDGFIVSSALLAARAMHPNCMDYCMFAHTSSEKGHESILSFLGVRPVLNLGLRLGEGTGAALCLPLLRSAVNFLNEMASFDSAGVSTKS
ncbi:nicotinate-nucleotide--dimethylbenzimidazole phosphoribosyltransferase [Leptobacterium flavescens]|uniref:Nicotinate-nucleotide--dimethylbenzimidazole phosphoribosyltransferase n=1 Tax=Leptobacterium flavescens TaxID=472055 RepID=A0A6P0UJ72_9FLAO|nr:nicotinate-nucleotide--dimethylbenzimidazole phosphoribosyltransferase [Leptobacterium flavescens]NER11978.1 nicotinate-nucleotide--dimethylbenzimidazole phosphoribosyltransferase [Leptobacterium flavescens]